MNSGLQGYWVDTGGLQILYGEYVQMELEYSLPVMTNRSTLGLLATRMRVLVVVFPLGYVASHSLPCGASLSGPRPGVSGHKPTYR